MSEILKPAKVEMYYLPISMTRSWDKIEKPLFWLANSYSYWKYYLIRFTRPFQVDDEDEDLDFVRTGQFTDEPATDNARPSYTYVRDIPEWNEWKDEAPMHYEVRFKNKENDTYYGKCFYLKKDKDGIPILNDYVLNRYGFDKTVEQIVFIVPCHFHPEVRSWEVLVDKDSNVVVKEIHRRNL